jgi:hypothetical protein
VFFERAPISAFDTHDAAEGDNGRIETRRHRVSHDVSWLASGRRFPGEPRFRAPAMIGMVEATVERAGKTSLARRCSLSSATLSASRFAHAERAHWVSKTGSTGSWTSSSTMT